MSRAWADVVPYEVEIRRERDGLVRRVSGEGWTWNEASVYYWTEGNMSCEDNLAVAFGDSWMSKEVDRSRRGRHRCHSDPPRYSAVRFVLATGRVVDVEAAYRKRNPPPRRTYSLRQMRARLVEQLAAHGEGRSANV